MSDFNFNISSTQVFRAFKLWSFPLFKYSNILTQFFLYVFLASLCFILISFFSLPLWFLAIKITLALLACLIFFFELSWFVEVKVKHPNVSLSLSDALGNLPAYNLAEFLSLQVCDFVHSAIKKSKQKKLLGVSSESLLYFSLLQSTSMQMLMMRLGLDVKKLILELKNYLEKQHRDHQFTVSLSDSFKDTIVDAATLANERNKKTIGEKELLVALAHHDNFFKKVLLDNDLKAKDIENITLWLDMLETKITKRSRFWERENLSQLGSLGKNWASGFTIILDQFSIDWYEKAKDTIFGQIIGHEQEITEVEIILTKSTLSNVLIVGEPGVGAKSIVEALAQRCFLGTGLAELKSKRVVELNMVALLSQVKSPEVVEATLDQIFQEALASGNVILVIDRLDEFVEQKSQRPGAVDISAILATYLALPNFQCIGITSPEGLHKHLEQNPSFLEYFRKVEVKEVSELETIQILQNLALGLEAKYPILVTYPAIREIINLTGRYMPSMPFPNKAIEVLDEVASYVKSTKVQAVPGGQVKMVLPSHVATVISDQTRIPVGKMEFKEKSVLLNLEDLIHERIINQQEAVSEISVAMRRARSGLGSKKRPMGVFLFLGPTGVGKTETAKALAQIYFGKFSQAKGSYAAGQEKMIRLDMSEFQKISDIGRLLGQVSPVEEQGLLTTPVRENPFSLVLLDEIEKAHPNILNLFLQVFDEGYITDGQGRKVVFTNTIIICTSNAGSDMVFSSVEKGGTIDKDTIIDALVEKRIFRAEFINRFDATVFFRSLTKENLLDIAELNLQTLAKNLQDKDIEFIITPALKEKIVELSYKPQFGAREMRRVIQDNVESSIAQALLADKVSKGDTIEVNSEDFSVINHTVTAK